MITIVSLVEKESHYERDCLEFLKWLLNKGTNEIISLMKYYMLISLVPFGGLIQMQLLMFERLNTIQTISDGQEDLSWPMELKSMFKLYGH